MFVGYPNGCVEELTIKLSCSVRGIAIYHIGEQFPAITLALRAGEARVFEIRIVIE